MEPDAAPAQVINACPACGTLADVTAHEPFTRVTCPACHNRFRARSRFNHFTITEQIGVGGMSRVFRARDTSLGRDVALKILNKACSGDRQRVRQFEKEAEITAKISHPNVVRVYTAGRDQGHFYIAMELVSGGSLEHYLRDHRKMPEAAALDLAIDAVLGLKAAHEAGLIHRDIKPGNILLAEDGTPKIVDFGLAILARETAGSAEIWATPFYVPPETLHQEPEDFRSDIYSLGATLYHLLTGTPPCARDTVSLEELKRLKARQIQVKPAVHHLSAETCAVLERALSVKPEDRYRDYAGFLDHLKHARRRLRRGGKGKPWHGDAAPSRSWRHAGIAAAIVLAAAAALWLPRRPPPVPPGGGGLSLVTDADPAAGSDVSTSARFHAARDAMLSGDFGKARQFFEELAASPGVLQPTRNWSRFNAGLCALFMGDDTGARASYAAIAAGGLYEKTGEAAELASFFVTTSQWLAREGPVPPERQADCPPNSIRAIGLLAGGLKNWNAGEAAGALSFLEAFHAAQPPGKAGWVTACKSLSAARLADAAAAASLPETDFHALTAAQCDTAMAQARATMARLTLSGPVKDRTAAAIAAMDAAASQRKAALSAAAAGDHEQRANSELQRIQEINLACAWMAANYQFHDAAAKLNAIPVTTEEAKASLAAHRATWEKAAAFLDQISRDLSEHSVTGMADGPGGPVRATLSLNGSILTATVPGGTEIKNPLLKLPPSRLAAIAAGILDGVSDSDEFYRRGGLLHAFALRTGLTHTATAWAATLSAELRSFRQEQTALQTTGVVSMEPETPPNQ